MSAVLLVAFGAATGWAAASVLASPSDPLDANDFTLSTVSPGEVSASINLNTLAEWPSVPIGNNRATGTVTSVEVEQGDEVRQGSLLFRVNDRPVVVAQGEMPAYREIGAESHGDDVAQLQRMLADLELYDGAIDGRAMWPTAAAIRDWQRSLGVTQTGIVELGDVIFVPALPSRVSLDPEVIARGFELSGGEVVLRALPESPRFTVQVTGSQASMMPAGTRVETTSPEGDAWTGYVVEQRADEQSESIVVTLEGKNGATICGAQCEQIAVTDAAPLASRVVTVETVAGLVVPSAAIVSTGAGQLAVLDATGAQLPVTVLASARGLTVVEGVDAGTKVRVPGSVSTP